VTVLFAYILRANFVFGRRRDGKFHIQSRVLSKGPLCFKTAIFRVRRILPLFSTAICYANVKLSLQSLGIGSADLNSVHMKKIESLGPVLRACHNIKLWKLYATLNQLLEVLLPCTFSTPIATLCLAPAALEYILNETVELC
jgi:hypothetical protein